MIRICRSCLEPTGSKMYPLQGDIVNVNITVADMLKFCSAKEVKLDENWPTHVCTPCFKTIRIAYNFLIQFEESQSLLEQKIIKGKVGTENKVFLQKDNHNSEEEKSEKILRYEVAEFHNYAEKWNGTAASDFESDFDATESTETVLEIPNTEENNENKETVTYLVEDGSENNIKVVFENFNENVKLEDNTVEECLTQQVLDEAELKQNTNSQFHIRKKFMLKQNNYSSFLMHKCPLCSHANNTFRAFSNHLMSHNSAIMVCTKCKHKPQFPLRDFIQHYKARHRYECPFCLKNLRTSYGYMYHISMHLVNQESSKKFKCTFEGCNREFVLLNLWKTHIKNHLRSSRSYQCEKCSQICNTYDTFRYHQKTHDGTRNHLCSLCGKSFFQAVHLRDHMYRHIGYKKFKCDLCKQAAFVTKHQLQKHVKYCSRKFLT